MTRSRNRYIYTATFILKIALIAAIMNFPPDAPLSHSAALGLIQKGMCFVTWEKDRFLTAYSDAALKKLTSIGVEYVSICITQYQEKYDSTDIIRMDSTPSDLSVKHVIDMAHSLGLKVMLKPHIDLLDRNDGTYWRADIGFREESKWIKWFTNYENFILHYAKIARDTGAELFCVGTELSFAAERTEDWYKIIGKTKNIYGGQLLYAANWDDYKNIKFWDKLDYVGINAYFPLSYELAPSLESLKKGWKKWKNEIRAWQSKINRPIIFSEIGYPSAQHASYEPWKNGQSGNPDPELQANCYRAFFETTWNEPWLAGTYWWDWGTSTMSGGLNNRSYTPQNKPAEKIIEVNYKNLPADNHGFCDNQPFDSSSAA